MSDKVGFTKLALADIGAVFGERGVALAREHGYVLTDVDKVRLDDDLNAVLLLTETGSSDPFTRIHEFAHLYHCHYWPDVSNYTPVHRVEAVAMVAETLLREKRHFPQDWLLARDRLWRASEHYAQIRGVVDKVKEFCYADFHETIGAVLWGKFG